MFCKVLRVSSLAVDLCVQLDQFQTFWEILRVHLLLICVFKWTKLQMFWEIFESSFSVDLVVLNWTRLQMFGKTQEFICVDLVLNQTGLHKMFWEILGLLEVLQNQKNCFHNHIEGSIKLEFFKNWN
jgi:hypothetical protein